MTFRYIITSLIVAIFLAVLEYYFPNNGISTLYAISPAFIAIGFGIFDSGRPLKQFGWSPNFKYWGVILFWLSIVVVSLILLAFLLGHTEWNEKTIKKFLTLETLVWLLIGILINSGEEIGWRGYLFPKLLEKYGWWKSVLFTSLVWWVWHIPIMTVLQIRQFGEVQFFTQFIQLVGSLPTTVLLSIWFIQSKSVFAIAFAHQLSNFNNKWFLGLEHSAKTPIFFSTKSYVHLYSTENGIFGSIALFIIAGIVYYRFSKKGNRLKF